MNEGVCIQCYGCDGQCIGDIWNLVGCVIGEMCLLEYYVGVDCIWNGCQLVDYCVFDVELFDDLWYL